MRNLETIGEIKDELFYCDDYLLTLEAQRKSLVYKRKALLKNGDAAAASDVDAEIRELDALIARVRHKKQGLLILLAPFAQIDAYYIKDASTSGTVRRWNLLHKIIRWLNELELEPDEDTPWITTGLIWFLADSDSDFEPWLTWKFSD